MKPLLRSVRKFTLTPSAMTADEEEHRESGRRLSSIGYDATMPKALDGLAARPAG